MKALHQIELQAALLLLVLATLACQAQAKPTAVPAPSTAIQKPVSTPGHINIKRDVTFGTGPFSLEDPQTGLKALSSYQAALIIAFEGTENGKPSKWSK